MFDCGPLGEGNHGHFDCLSFELAAHGRSLVVDPGRYTYSEAGDINWRVRFRSTASHNTVLVDGRNQTRYAPKPVAAGTRHTTGSVRHRITGPAPIAQLESAIEAGPHIHLCGTARSSEYDALHTRHLLFAFGEYWVVADRMEAPAAHRYTQRFQLGPEAESATRLERADTTVTLHSPGLTLGVLDPGRTQCTLQPSWVSFEYGHKLAAPALCVERDARDTWLIAVFVADPHGHLQPRLTALPAPGRGATAFELTLTTPDGVLRDCFLLGGPDRAAFAVERRGVALEVTA